MKLSVIIITVGLLLIGCNEAKKIKKQNENTSLVAKRFRIDELREEIEKLKNGQTDFDFFGITSNGIDCIYFTYDNQKFNIEYEAIIESQIAYIDKIKEFANSQEYTTEIKTYNNQPKYKSDKPAPVLRIVLNSEINEVIEIGQNIQNIIFKNTEETIYDVVP